MRINNIDRIFSRISDIMSKENFTPNLKNHTDNFSKKFSSNVYNSNSNINTKLNWKDSLQSAIASNTKKDFNSNFPQKNLNALIEKEAHKQSVSPDLIKAIVKVESGSKINAVSPKGAIGLMQLMPETAKELGVNPNNPEENLYGGINYLKNMASRYGDLDLALAAYNAGPKAVDKYGGVPPYKETLQYIKSIRKNIGL